MAFSEVTGVSRVGDLDLLDELGRGAQTVVYRARRGGHEYAVKLLRADVGRDGERARALFRREASVLASLRHPGLAQIYAADEVDGRPYLVLELLEGDSLETALSRRGQLPAAEVIALGTDVAGALAMAHRVGLVHRDVKPDNIVVAPDGRAKVIDFGLVEQAGADHGGEVAGTVAYSAPEQTGMLRRPVDGRSDLYALGVVLFRCLTGHLPFSAPDPAALIRLHAVAPPPDVAKLRPDVPPMLSAIIAKLLAKDPDDRYQSGDGLVSDLRRVDGVADFPLGAADNRDVGGDLPLVGRAAELDVLVGVLTATATAGGGVALIEGHPGGGKSRLVRELLGTARGAGDLILSGKSVPDAAPLAPLREALDVELRRVQRLPDAERAAALGRLHAAAGAGLSLLKALTPALAELFPDAPDLPAGQDLHDQFLAAVAGLLTGLARESGRAVLYLDDVQWLDEATRAVLRRLSNQISDAPLLLVCTARDDAASEPATERFAADVESALRARIRLEPLDRSTVGTLVAAMLGGATVEDGFVATLAQRTGGNPFAVVEYVRAVLDAGLFRPAWGHCTVDQEALDSLRLPANVLELVLARVERLGTTSRPLLTAAAVIGNRFALPLLADLCQVTVDEARHAVAEAVRARLVEPLGGDGYVFVHDRIPEALLSQLTPVDLADLHERAGLSLDRLGDPADGEPERVFALARHYALGRRDRPDRVFAAIDAAGRLALASHAVVDAVGYFEQAAEVGTVPAPEFWETFGMAYMRAGRLAEAQRAFEHALATSDDPLCRARVLRLLSNLEFGRWNAVRARQLALRGMAESGAPLPANAVLLLLTSVPHLVAGLLCGWLKIGYGRAAGELRERLQVRAACAMVGCQSALLDMDAVGALALIMRALYLGNRVGPSPVLVEVYGTLAAVAGNLRLRRLAAWIGVRTARVAALLADPSQVAYAEYTRAFSQSLSGDCQRSLPRFRYLLDVHGPWLSVIDYQWCFTMLIANLNLRSGAREAVQRFDALLVRTRDATDVDLDHTPHVVEVIPALSLLGRTAEAQQRLAASTAVLDHLPDSRILRAAHLFAQLHFQVDQNELGEPFERTVAEFDALGLTNLEIHMPLRAYFAVKAYGRLQRYATSPAPARAAQLPAVEAAIKELGWGHPDGLLRAHHLAARASLTQLRGRHRTALRQLARAERYGYPLDSPWLEYEIARIRARALRGLGKDDVAARHAATALVLAEHEGWVNRAAQIRSEFPASERRAGSTHSSHTLGGVVVSDASLRHKRQLDALLQVGVAASNVLEPTAVARVALDEILRIVGAERAYLFLCAEDSARLDSGIGRDADGNDLGEITGYSSTVVERVRLLGEPLIVTGTDEGEELGSQSAVAHGLRSIMAVPLRLDDRLLGIVYLDSRLARGVFTTDDVEILVAIAGHVAVSLQTARTAQLELAVHAERRQRTLAENMRASLAAVSGSLAPAEVLQRVLDSAADLIPYHAAAVLLCDDGVFTVAAVAGPIGTPDALGRRIPVSLEPALTPLLDPGATAVLSRPDPTAPTPLTGVIGDATSWICAPLLVRGTTTGVVVFADTAGDYGAASAEIAGALAGQGAVAYQNAMLFSQVEKLATVDELTGVNSRRQFFAEAGALFSAAADEYGPLTAIMIDIDHFKQVNDGYGHGVGDEVIRCVARRLTSALRAGDILGRYGGEEFAMLLPTEQSSALGLGERLRTIVAGDPVPTAAGPLAVTISLGVAELRPGDPDVQAVLNRADGALYEAKRTGRNRVATA